MTSNPAAAIVISTIDRAPKANYLGETMRGLRDSGLWSPAAPSFAMVLVDSGSPDPRAHYATQVAPYLPADREITHDCCAAGGRRTHNVNANRAAELAAAINAEWTLFCEDDIAVCSRFLESALGWLEDHFDQRWLLYALGCPYDQTVHALHRGETSWLYPIEAFYGTQCVAVHRTHLAHMAEWLQQHPKYQGWGDRHHDLNLHDWAADRNPSETYFLASVPSLVQHTGRESTLNNKHFVFPSWQGPQWSYKRRVSA